jgi:VWFA-related protein
MRKNLYILILTCLFSLTGYAQTAAPTVVPKQPDDDEIIKISTALVQIDATVTDKSGNIITDLKPEDFEIYANGKKQEITNFSLVNGQKISKWISAGKSSGKAASPATPLPPITRPEQVRRTIAIVVDDLGLSAETLTFTKYAVKKYINDQIQPGDMVAVISTSKGVGTLLQFTTDKRLLDAAVSGIYWNIKSREGLLPNKSIETPTVGQTQMGAVVGPPMNDRNIGIVGNELQQRAAAGGAFGRKPAVCACFEIYAAIVGLYNQRDERYAGS